MICIDDSSWKCRWIWPFFQRNRIDFNRDEAKPKKLPSIYFVFDPLLGLSEMMFRLPRSQTSLSLRKWWARKGGREGERMRDVWEILFSRWRNVQWRMITQFSKRSIDLFVLGIFKEKWFSLIHCARRKLFSYNRTGYSIITGFAISMPFSCRKN